MVYLFLAAHFAADFILQPFWLVLRKRRWDGLLIHGGIVLACMLALGLIDLAVLPLWPAMLAITMVHIAADWWKVNRADRLIRSPIGGFLLDQVIHIATITAAVSLSLPLEQAWMVEGSPAALTAIYVSVYIIAALATPIGVMVWLDPTFAHAAQAAWARVRSLFAGVAVVSLILLGGIAALPATLLGFAVAAHRPASAHPLDTPRGLLTTLLVAATLGWLLVMIRS